MKFIDEIDVKNKVLLMRVNLNVPIKEGKIQDDFRIRVALPTIEYAQKNAKKTVICAHLGRPKTHEDRQYTLAPVAEYLRMIFGEKVIFLNDCIGNDIKQAIDVAADGSIIVLENVRFHKGERNNDEAFGRALSQLGDIYVNEAFGDSYDNYASVTIPPKFLPHVGGLRLKKEIEALAHLKTMPNHPFVVIIGGVKISEKMGTIKELGKRADKILVGGGVGNTLLAAAGFLMRESLVLEEEMPLAESLLVEFKEKIVLPVDGRFLVKKTDGSIDRESLRIGEVGQMRSGDCMMDVGPKTLEMYKEIAGAAKDVFWAGPLGYIEWDLTAVSSAQLAKHLANLPNFTAIGGGETASLAAEYGLLDKMDFVSTGGGAALKYLSGEALPGLTALE